MARRVRRRAGRVVFVVSVSRLVAGMVASPFVLLWDAVGGARRLDGRWILRAIVLLCCLSAISRPAFEGAKGVREGWLDRGMGASSDVTGLPFSTEINEYSRAAGLDPRLVAAVIRVESAFRPDAISPKGAAGLMQVMPGTWREVADSLGWAGAVAGVETMCDPSRNIRIGTTYLARMLDACDRRVGEALAAYNGGLSNLPRVREMVAEADMRGETILYVSKVYVEWDTLCDRSSTRSYSPMDQVSRRVLLWLWAPTAFIVLLWLSINCLRWISNPVALSRRIRW